MSAKRELEKTNRRYLIINSPYNRANYPKLIGRTYHRPPVYVEVVDRGELQEAAK
jgi:hypothetical protein